MAKYANKQMRKGMSIRNPSTGALLGHINSSIMSLVNHINDSSSKTREHIKRLSDSIPDTNTIRNLVNQFNEDERKQTQDMRDSARVHLKRLMEAANG